MCHRSSGYSNRINSGASRYGRRRKLHRPLPRSILRDRAAGCANFVSRCGCQIDIRRERTAGCWFHHSGAGRHLFRAGDNLPPLRAVRAQRNRARARRHEAGKHACRGMPGRPAAESGAARPRTFTRLANSICVSPGRSWAVIWGSSWRWCRLFARFQEDGVIAVQEQVYPDQKTLKDRGLPGYGRVGLERARTGRSLR
jgi:hypothetical protein